MTDQASPIDRIRLTGLRVFAHHGVLDFERENGQEFIIDLEIAVDLAPAPQRLKPVRHEQRV